MYDYDELHNKYNYALDVFKNIYFNYTGCSWTTMPESCKAPFKDLCG